MLLLRCTPEYSPQPKNSQKVIFDRVFGQNQRFLHAAPQVNKDSLATDTYQGRVRDSIRHNQGDLRFE